MALFYTSNTQLENTTCRNGHNTGKLSLKPETERKRRQNEAHTERRVRKSESRLTNNRSQVGK